MAKSPFKVNVYVPNPAAHGGYTVSTPDVTFNDFRAIDSTFRNNALGNVQMRVASSHPGNAACMMPDAWAEVFYRGKREMTGKIRTRQGSFLDGKDRIYQIRDDRAILDDVLAIPVPLGLTSFVPGPITPGAISAFDGGQWFGDVPGQAVGDLAGAVGYYDWASERPGWTPDWPFGGLPTSVEGAIRKLFFENVARVTSGLYILRPGLPATNLNRGLPITALSDLPAVRFGKLSDYIDPLAAASGLNVRIYRDPTTSYRALDPEGADPDRWANGPLFMDISEPREWGSPLTAASGIIVEPSTWTVADPTATRAIVGGPGELAQRSLLAYPEQYQDNNADELRLQWVSEIFRDATSTQLVWPDTLDEALRAAIYYAYRPEVDPDDKAVLAQALLKAAQSGLSDGAASSGLSLTLSETPGFHYGGSDGIQLGDIVTAVTPTGLEFRDQLTEVAISYGKDGLKVTPKVGNRTEDRTRDLYERIARLAASQRRLSANK